MWIVCYFIVETSKVEAIQNEIFIDFAKVFVAFGGKEPGDPL